MSDLEATKSQAQTAAPITAIASAKLRRISPGAPALAESSGLVDAFAEVFARIASTANEIQSQGPVDDAGADQIDAGEQATRSDESDSSQSDSNQSAPEAQVKVDLGVEVDVETNDEQLSLDVDDGVAVAEDLQAEITDPLNDGDDDVTVVADVNPDNEVDDSDTEQVVIAAVNVLQTESVEQEAEAADVIVHEVQPEEEQDHRRERKKSTSVEPVENSEEGRHRGRHAAEGEQVPGASETDDVTSQEQLEGSDQVDPGQSSRRLRGFARYSRDADPASQAASQAEAQRPQQPITAANNSESIANSAARSFEAPSPAGTSQAESAVVNVNNIASRIQQSGTASGTQAGTRGSTHAIESTLPAKSGSSPKSAPSEKQGTNAETVSRIKLIQRVSKAFQHLGPDGGVVRLRLAPPDMGSVRVEMRINQHKVHGRVVAESEAASAALREHLPDLRARLESFGMQVEKLDVETETQDQRQGSPFDAEPRHQQQQQQRQREDHRWLGPPVEAGENVSQQVSRATIEYGPDGLSSGVDIRL
jgi:flagellar hook-length control protein FliK